jgi:monofunctional biosynthetic peptidoglycan transglycosylase
MAARRRRKQAGVMYWLRRVILVCFLAGLIPAGLTLLYAPTFVHPVSTLMVKDVVILRGYDRQWVSIDDVAPALVKSVIMSEDGQFCFHRGVDLAELSSVIDDAISGEGVRGASTVPMQTVKNLFLWHRPFGTVRKVIELPLAVYMDVVLSKRRIMEIYLNIAEWGPDGIYGIEAAAQHHFGKPASKLTKRQAALLAVTLPNPIARNPGKPSNSLSNLAARIERRVAQAQTQFNCIYPPN